MLVGRIEVVTPEQRALLRALAAGPSPTVQQLAGILPYTMWEQEGAREVLAGRRPLASLPVHIPPLYEAYLRLGRFRNALVLDELKRRPTAPLREFISVESLGPYRVR